MTDIQTRTKTALPLYPFQAETVEFMVKAQNALNANFVGSGKTLTSLAVCEKLNARRVLVVVPKSVLFQWAKIEIPKWLPNARVLTINGTPQKRLAQYRQILSHDFVVIGYETARTDIMQLVNVAWDVIIVDEAHRLASTTTLLYKALNRLYAKHRFALTATPVMNKAEDLFGIINWLKNGALGTWWHFMNRYVVRDHWGNPRSYRNVSELNTLTAPFIIKKTLAEVGMQLPPYTEIDLPVELSAVERKNYDLIRAELLFEIEPHIINKIENPIILQNVVVKLGKLFEVCDHLSLIGALNVSSKLELLKEHLESRAANGEKIIIITRFARMAHILQKELQEYKPLLITGQSTNRAETIEIFSTDPDRRILIGTEAIAQGLNLQIANVLYNYDSAWNPARMEQRAGRIYRNGQDKPVFIYNLVVSGSVETWLKKKLESKQELSDRLLPKSFIELKEILQ